MRPVSTSRAGLNQDAATFTPLPMAAPDSALPASPSSDASAPRAPTLRRRLAAMVYEGVLLFGLLTASTALYLFGLRPALQRAHLDHPYLIQVWSFLVLGLYFTWFWHRSGQTLAMQTWRIRVETAAGTPLAWRHAVLRYVLAWLWLPPAAALGHMLGLIKGPFVGLLAGGLLVWLALSWLDPQRQFLHDRLARTRLVRL
jgi:uncharacterized RDD family membrane protein YckC